MTRKIRGLLGIASLLLLAWSPASADTQFRIRRMVRNDVPLGKGQCDIRLQVDNEVEVQVQGDMVVARTISGRDARDDGSECNEPLPTRDVGGVNFEVLDRRGDIAMIAEPSGRNGYRAMVRIRDNGSGEGRYHFRLSWRLDGGGPGFDRGGPPPGRGPETGPGRGPETGPGYGPGDRDDRGRGYDRDDRGRREGGPDVAMQACRDAVTDKVAREYRYDEVQLRDVRVDDRPGRRDSIIGEAVGRRRNTSAFFRFYCDVDFRSGRVRNIDVRRR